MAAIIKLWIGCMIIAALGAVAIHTDVMPGSAQSAERKLQASVSEAVAGADWASVFVDGQRVVINGEAPSIDAVIVVADVVAHSAGSGGFLNGGVTSVDTSAVSIFAGPPPVAPYIWAVRADPSGVVLSGYAPSQSARDAILQLAAMRFPDSNISGSLQIASGSPPAEQWLAATSLGLQALSHLKNGEISAVDAQFDLLGSVENEAAAETARDILKSMPSEFIARSELAVIAPPPDLDTLAAEQRAAQAEETAVAAANAAATLAACQQEAQEAFDRERITFPSSRARLDQENQSRLRAFADILSNCPQLTLNVIGHTDSSGNEARNEQLSLSRADAVSAYLQTLGITASRLTTEGAGSARPIANNRNAQGRARNRRIEFQLTVNDQNQSE